MGGAGGKLGRRQNLIFKCCPSHTLVLRASVAWEGGFAGVDSRLPEMYRGFYFQSHVCRQHSNGMDPDCADIHPASVLVGLGKEREQDG